MEQNAINHAVDHGGGADTEGKGKNRQQCKRAVFAQAPECVAQVLPNGRESIHLRPRFALEMQTEKPKNSRNFGLCGPQCQTVRQSTHIASRNSS